MQPEKQGSERISLYKLYKAELILLAITFTWGLSFPLIKISLQFVSPILFNLLRFSVTLIVFYIFYRDKLVNAGFKDLKCGFILGFYLFAGFALQTSGLKYTTASKSAFITGTILIMLPFIHYFILKTKPKAENLIGAAIVMTGLYILSDAYFNDLNPGDILTLFCAFAFAIHIVLLDKYSRKIDLNYLIFGQFLAMVAFNLVYMIIFEVFIFEEIFIKLNSELIMTLIYTSIFSTLISIVLMTKYQNKTTPLRAGIIYNMESVFAVFFAYILLKEVLSYSQLSGIFIMLTGFAISEFYLFFKFKYLNGKKGQYNC
ncbi:MAG TPA: DMT family transporter [Ignavibacteria bacterium]|nr:DMT family transporter [Ignavibacteria bacterium]